MTRAISVNKETCISGQLCADSLPQVFRMDDQGWAEVHDSNDVPEEHLQKMIDACPGHTYPLAGILNQSSGRLSRPDSLKK